jgi:hypothetical protein
VDCVGTSGCFVLLNAELTCTLSADDLDADESILGSVVI